MVEIPASAGWVVLITCLLLNCHQYDNKVKWEAMKSRLRVNGGCGHISAEEYKAGDRNTEFALIPASEVPDFVKEDFMNYAKEWDYVD